MYRWMLTQWKRTADRKPQQALKTKSFDQKKKKKANLWPSCRSRSRKPVLCPCQRCVGYDRTREKRLQREGRNNALRKEQRPAKIAPSRERTNTRTHAHSAAASKHRRTEP
jgi:hypothetical protein